MKTIAFFLVFTLILFSVTLGFCETDRIVKVDVMGNERIDKAIVTNTIKTKENEVYDPEKIAQDLKNIYKTGFFSDVMADVKETDKGKVVTFVVVERPPITVIYITGNDKIKTEDIRDKLKIKSGSVLNTDKVKDSVDEIKKLYASKGYYATIVSYEFTQEKGEKAGLRFVIKEPKKALIDTIKFIGNKTISSRELRGIMRVKESGLFSLFTGSGILDEENLEEDKKNIEAYYYDKGYVRAKVSTPTIRVSKDGKDIFIDIPISEGPVHTVGDISFKGDVIFDEATVRKKLQSRKGKTFRSSLFREDMLMITDIYQEKGYAFADISPLSSIDDEKKAVNVVFEIAKGPEIYINRINIAGNVKTRDKVIRRELRLAEGDRYSISKIKESKRLLTNTTFFKEVDLKTVKTDEPDKVNLDVTVEEKPTGTISLGVGYSSYEQALVNGSISQENLFGTGRKLFLDASLSSKTQNFNLTMVEPYVFNKDYSASFNAFNTKRYLDTYDYGGMGGTVSVTRPLTEYTRGGIRYRYEAADVTNVSYDAGSYVLRQAGARTTSSTSVFLSKNTIDDVMNPTKGVITDISVETAGGPLGGTNDFIKAVGSYGQYFPFYWGSAFFLRGTAGTVRPYGGKGVPVYENFFVGGINTVRGFQYGYAGPRDQQFGYKVIRDYERNMSVYEVDKKTIIDGDVIGGSGELIFNAEWIFPLVKSAGVKGVVFFDAGHAFDNADGFLLDGIRTGAGFGIRWQSPIGPIRLELGFNLRPKDGEKASVFEFTMGRAF